ncbi:MAG TPA: ABC transporter ATP-binding protein [Bacillota bacterium]|nr:ABC transporter ATP-binding protein [Bacillota bacterium]
MERTGDAWAMAVKLDGVVVEYESWEYEGRRRKIQRRRALDGVTIGFAGGEIVGIEGPNASEKSTLLRTMCGIHVPISGEVLVYGKRPDIFDSDFKRRVGYVSSRRTSSFALHCELYGMDKYE